MTIIPVYVPGFAYYGWHLYADDKCLDKGCQSPHWDSSELERIAILCGTSLPNFSYPQAFCALFAERWPNGKEVVK